jgi:hypothetical protein
MFSKIDASVNASTPDFYYYLWDRNKGIFFRGSSSNSKETGFGVLGAGIYVTWEKGAANAFAKISSGKIGGESVVKKYKLPRDIKLIDWESSEMWEIRQSLGVKNRWDKFGDKVFAHALTYEVEKRGYDGVISSNAFDGIVIFDSSKLTEVR